jgi:membrane associated rhomboid family serine protease
MSDGSEHRGPHAPASRGQGPLTVVNALLVANVAVFLLWPVLPLQFMAEHFLVSWRHLEAGHVWVLLTAVFSHNLLVHLMVNLIVLLSFGAPLERIMGAPRFLLFYLVAGAAGSMAHAAASHFLIGDPERAALGASSALAGVLLLFSLSFPKARVLLFFFIPLPAIVAALAFVAIDIWGLIVQIEGQGLPIGHGAHLGGALAGTVYFIVRGRQLRERAAHLS